MRIDGRFATRVAVLLLGVAACCGGCATTRPERALSTPTAATVPVLSPAIDAASAGLVDAQVVIDGLRLEMRYAGSHNFIGEPIDGYDAPKCLLLRSVAAALARVETALRLMDQRLLVYDCYRPVRAVAHFMRWALDADALSGKAEFFPTLDKSVLVPQYIAERSGHSHGATLDLTLMQCDGQGNACAAVDMGTGFDFFGERAHTDSPSVSVVQRANRHALRDAMVAAGFVNYADEWWHYTQSPEPRPLTEFDVPIR